jgi:hypothetical protein
MAASLIKMNINGSAAISLTQSKNRYVATVSAGMISGNTTTIADINFVDDNGIQVVPGGLPTSGLYDVFINGVLQQSGLSTILATQVVVNAALGIGTPVILTNSLSSGSSTIIITT